MSETWQSKLPSASRSKPRLLHFGVSDDTAWEVGLTCGGKISVFVEPLDVTWWHLAADHVRQNEVATTVTVIEGEQIGQKALFDAAGGVQYASSGLTSAELVQVMPTQARTGRTSLGEMPVLVERHQPRPHLIIIGGVHVAMPLQFFARQLGFRVSIIDPRQVFATTERFPDVETILHSYPDKFQRMFWHM